MHYNKHNRLNCQEGLLHRSAGRTAFYDVLHCAQNDGLLEDGQSVIPQPSNFGRRSIKLNADVAPTHSQRGVSYGSKSRVFEPLKEGDLQSHHTFGITVHSRGMHDDYLCRFQPVR